jgi:branched-subunit amino acid aminotransferase/4-amino-4-deoxychorismate lyase
MIAFSNGRYHPSSEPAVTLDNGGFLHGYGVFTTFRLYRGRAPHLAEHFQRLQHHGRQLDLAPPATLQQTSEVISELVKVNQLQNKDMKLRLTLTTQAGGLHFSAVPGDLPPELPRWQLEGVGATLLGPEFRRAHLPAIKTSNYLPSVLALQQANRSGCPEAVITGEDGFLLEGAVSNLFLVRRGELLTPPADGRILAGLTRNRVLELARAGGRPCRQAALGPDDLFQAEEAFLTNSVREVVPLVQLDGAGIGNGSPGPVTRCLQASYRDSVARAAGLPGN